MNTVLAFPPSETFTPKQALLSALELAKNDNLNDILIVGYDGEGHLLIRSSRMDRRDALWMAEQLRQYALFQE